MTATVSPLRAVVRTLNVAGRTLARLGHQPISLDERSVIDQARQETRLEDFGGDEFREPLRRLLEAYDRTLGSPCSGEWWREATRCRCSRTDSASRGTAP